MPLAKWRVELIGVTLEAEIPLGVCGSSVGEFRMVAVQ